MDLKQLYEAYKAKLAEARQLADQFKDKEMPKDTATQIDTILGKADEIRATIDREEKLAAGEKFMNEPLAPKAAFMGTPSGAQSVEVIKDAADQDFKNSGEFFRAVKEAGLYPGREDVRLRSRKEEKATGMSEGVPADGGYLLPVSSSRTIEDRMYAIGGILSRVSMDPVEGNSMTYNGLDETSRIAGSRWGGLLGYWVAEGAAITGSKPKFRQIELKLKKVAALCYATDEQLEDTRNLQSWLERVVPDELRFQAEDAIIEGDGLGKPLGIMNSPCLVSQLRVDANEIDATDIAKLWSRRWTGVSDYVWLVSASIFPQLINLVVGNFPLMTMIGGFQSAPYNAIFGKPVIESEYCQALGTTGDILLASLSQYQAISKDGVNSASSIHVAFTTDEMAFRFTYRIHGAPTWHSALTPLHGSTTVSPFVVLATASV